MASIRKRVWANKGVEKSAWVVDYFDQSQTKRRKTFATKKEAVNWATTALHEVKQGIHTPASISVTVARAGELWLEECEADGLERSTIRQRGQHLKHHINPHLGGVRLSELTTPSVYNFDGQLRKAGTSLAMRRKILTSIKTLLSFAQKQALVAQNVASPVKLKRDDREDSGPLREGVDYPSRAQMKQLLDSTAKLRWRALLVTAMFSGMRASELRGLPWANVDLDAGVIHVRQRADAWGKIGKPKSKAGSRDIPLAPIVINTLREWKVLCPKRETDKKDDAGQPIMVLDLVFPNGLGHVESLQNIYKRYWDPIQPKAFKDESNPEHKPPRFGFHSLRHVAASMFIAYLNWTPKRVQEVMGHSSITVTYDCYGHLFQDKDADRDAMKKLEAAIVAA
ncbi:tyrosine-type recombinase/integrase [Nitrobacter sp. JJSN]|uniref:tyrosine-type recombinase/integrase n=1 Tax=Nitrobacter sp. JJSN TaxID=3453033 RepID=UPI003F764A1C